MKAHRQVKAGKLIALLREAGLRLPYNAALEVVAKLDGARDLHEAQVRDQSPSDEVTRVLTAVQDVFQQLANEAGDVAIWNEGGAAYEASRGVRNLLRHRPGYPAPAQSRIWLVIHSHRHGHDYRLLAAPAQPTIAEAVARTDLDFEPDREDESIELQEITDDIAAAYRGQSVPGNRSR